MIEAGPGDYMIADAYRDQVALNVINRDNLANLVASVRQQAEDAMREWCAEIVDDKVKRLEASVGPLLGWSVTQAKLKQARDLATAICATPPKPDRLNGEGV